MYTFERDIICLPKCLAKQKDLIRKKVSGTFWQKDSSIYEEMEEIEQEQPSRTIIPRSQDTIIYNTTVTPTA